MKPPVIISVCLLLCIYSCKRDHYDAMLPTPDFRDTVCGDYTGSMHHVQTQVWGAYTTIDTTYAYTLHVAVGTFSSSNANSLWMGGVEMDADPNYALHMNSLWSTGHPRQAASGQFNINASLPSLYFRHSDSWQGTSDIYTFQGTKN